MIMMLNGRKILEKEASIRQAMVALIKRIDGKDIECRGRCLRS